MRDSVLEKGRFRGVGEGAGDPEGVEFLLKEKRPFSCCKRPPEGGVLNSEGGRGVSQNR